MRVRVRGVRYEMELAVSLRGRYQVRRTSDHLLEGSYFRGFLRRLCRRVTFPRYEQSTSRAVESACVVVPIFR